MSVAAVLPRRERLRRATVAEIKTVARAQLAEEGAGALSLRRVARSMGMTPSALYRYVPSREELITMLISDAYNSLTDTLEAARDAIPAHDHVGRWLVVTRSYRGWALEHPTEFALIYGSPIPGYTVMDEGPTHDAGRRFGAMMFGLMIAALADGVVDLDAAAMPFTPRLEETVRQVVDHRSGMPLPERAIAVCLAAWASMLGLLTLEVFGHLRKLVVDAGPLFDAQMRAIAVGMGYDPAEVDRSARRLVTSD